MMVFHTSLVLIHPPTSLPCFPDLPFLVYLFLMQYPPHDVCFIYNLLFPSLNVLPPKDHVYFSDFDLCSKLNIQSKTIKKLKLESVYEREHTMFISLGLSYLTRHICCQFHPFEYKFN